MFADGRQTEREIAKKIGEAREAVKKNLAKMEEHGVITGATTHINYKSFGYLAVAHILISVDAGQESQLADYLKNMPEIYGFYSRGIKGNWDVLVKLRTLAQLDDIKDAIKRRFAILEMKSAIWTDVKEMNYNLAIADDNSKEREASISYQVKTQKGNPQTSSIDDVDLKIADKLSEDGRIPMEILGKEVCTSPDTAKRRYEKLKKSGALKVTIQVNPNKIGYTALCVFFTVTSHENSFAIIEEISRIPDVISIMKTTGDYDLQIYAMVKNLQGMFQVQGALGKIQGITRMDAEILPLTDWIKWPSPRQYISTF